jgi:hypothetical protein
VKVVIYILVGHTPPHSLVDTRTLGTIRLTILVLAINHSKVIEFRDGITPNRLSTFCPIRRTHLAMLILYAYRTLSVPSNPQKHITVVHRDLPQHTLRIDQITRPERDPLVLDQTPILACHAHVTVRQQQNAQIGPEATCSAGLLRPGVVRVLRVS